MAKKKKTIKQEMVALLKADDNQKALCQGLLESAAKGNANAAQLILRIVNQDPSKPQVDEDNDPFGD